MTVPFDTWLYSVNPPPEPSDGLRKWLSKIEQGWKPNKRLRSMGYENACDYYRVYVWEYTNILRHKLWEACGNKRQ